MPPECLRFIENLEELALGTLDEPTRTEMFQHADDCARCRARLDQLTWVTDQLLEVAPAIDPPAGFESRVLSRLGMDAKPDARRLSSARSRWWLAAAVAIGLVVGGFALGRGTGSTMSGAEWAVKSGIIQREDGSRTGAIVLSRTPRPHVLVTIDHPRPSGDVMRCVLVGANGQRTEVGSWSYRGVERGAWAVGIDPALLDSQRMEVVDPTGSVVATASLAAV
jgi:hypothetical protein